MALLGWYPLNGDTKDYSGNEKHGTPINMSFSSGKIGQAGDFTGSNSWIDLEDSFYLPNNSPFSVAGWVYYRSFSSRDMLLCRNDAVKSGSPYTWLLGTRDGDRMYAYDGSSWHQQSYSFEVNTWYHLTFVFDGEKMYFYLNGDKIGESNWSFSDSLTGRNTQIGGYSGSTGDVDGKVNDVRIYDHALSKKEIKELAKAKVLHYNFNDFQEPTENLTTENHFSGFGSSASINEPYNKTRAWQKNISRTNGTPYNIVNIDCDSDQEYIFSIYIKKIEMSSNGHILLYARTNTTDTTSVRINSSDLTNEFKRFEISHTTASDSDFFERLSLQFRSGFEDGENVEIEIADWQLEKKSYSTLFTPSYRPGTILDSSGYENHASLELDTTPRWTDDSVIGTGAYEFLSSSSSVSVKDSVKWPSNEWTYSFWFKHYSEVTGSWRSFLNRSSRQPGLWMYNSSNRIHYSVRVGDSNSSASIDTELNKGQWYHIAITAKWDGESGFLKSYLNGQLEGSRSISEPISTATSDLWFGEEDMFFDDFRVYTTALPDSDIEELYQSRALIDKDGNLYINTINSIKNLYYDSGEEYLQNTGGWIEGYSYGEGLQEKKDEYLLLQLSDGGDSHRTYVTNNKIDITNINKINIDWECPWVENVWARIRFQTSNNQDGDMNDRIGNELHFWENDGTAPFDRRVDSIDVSSLSGKLYLKCVIRRVSQLKVYRIWGSV